MATSRITIRSIDYHKFRGLVVDRTGNIDDRDRCDREMAALCDAVHRLNCRDERFDGIDDNGRSFGGGSRRDLDDRARLGEICGWYKLILESRRVRSVDVRLRSGWWDGRSNDRNGLNAGRLRSSSLRETLVEKTLDWVRRHQFASWGRLSSPSETDIDRALDNPGVYIFKHRERKCFQLVGSTGSVAQQAGNSSVFSVCSDVLREAYDGASPDPLSALLVTSLAHSWDFYFVPVAVSDGATLLRVVENDAIMKHDSLWPYGLNVYLRVQSFFELSQLRSSCRRHRWPPLRENDPDDDVIAQQQPPLAQLRLQLNNESKCDDSVLDLLAVDNDVTNDTRSRSQSAKARRPNRINSTSRESTSPLGVLVVGSSSSSRCRRHGNDAPDVVDGANSSDSDGSSLGSTITATTVRTAINKSTLVQDYIDELPQQISLASEAAGVATGGTRGRIKASSSSSTRSTSAMPAAMTRARCEGQGHHQRIVSRARSASQTGEGQRTVGQRPRMQATERRINEATSHHGKK